MVSHGSRTCLGSSMLQMATHSRVPVLSWITAHCGHSSLPVRQRNRSKLTNYLTGARLVTLPVLWRAPKSHLPSHCADVAGVRADASGLWQWSVARWRVYMGVPRAHLCRPGNLYRRLDGRDGWLLSQTPTWGSWSWRLQLAEQHARGLVRDKQGLDRYQIRIKDCH